jgi:hypothetical protein
MLELLDGGAAWLYAHDGDYADFRVDSVVTGRAGNGERLALAALTWIGEPGDVCLGALARVHGPIKALELLRAGQVPGRAEIAAAFGSGLLLICPGDAEWPAELDAFGEGASLALWARGSGDLAEACARAVAITGTRACRAFGSQAAETLASALSPAMEATAVKTAAECRLMPAHRSPPGGQPLARVVTAGVRGRRAGNRARPGSAPRIGLSGN